MRSHQQLVRQSKLAMVVTLVYGAGADFGQTMTGIGVAFQIMRCKHCGLLHTGSHFHRRQRSMKMDESRKQFEEWLTAKHDYYGSDFKWDESRNCYSEYGIHLAYQAWKASRQALEDNQ